MTARFNKVSDSATPAVAAGSALLLMTILAPVAHFGIFQKLIVAENATQTISNILGAEGAFRWGIILFMTVAVLDIIAAWALHVLFSPVDKNLSLLTAWFRTIYATVLLVAIVGLIIALQYITPDGTLIHGLTTAQRTTSVMLTLNFFTICWQFGLIIFGCHLICLGTLSVKSGSMHGVLGALLLLAATGYLIDGIGKILSAHYQLTIAQYTFFGEILLVGWLLTAGRTFGTRYRTHTGVQP